MKGQGIGIKIAGVEHKSDAHPMTAHNEIVANGIGKQRNDTTVD